MGNMYEGLNQYMMQQAISHKMTDVSNDGTEIAVTLLVNDVKTREDKNGNPYCDIVVSDGDASYNAKMWQTDADNCGFATGDLIDAVVKGNEYRGGTSYTIVRSSKNDAADANDYVLGAPVPVKEMWTWIEYRVSTMAEPYASIVNKMVVEKKSEYIHQSAARSNHHSFIGGLIYHSYRMARAVDALSAIYPVNADAVVAGALLHDIGKLRELETSALGVTEYTRVGQLEHHITLGVRMLDQAAMELGIDVESEPVAMLRHMILSHHGTNEFGSPVVPATAEAIMLHAVDALDMRETVWEAEVVDLEPGSHALNMNYVLDARAYKPAE